MPVEPVVLPKTILLKGRLSQRHEEYSAGGAINPGYMLKMTSTGTVVAHPTAGLNFPAYFAKEDGLTGGSQGGLQGGTINTPYASADIVFVHIAEKGDVILAKLAAAATAVALGDSLTSAGNGTLKKANGTTDLVVAFAKQAVDNSAGGSEAFIKVEIV